MCYTKTVMLDLPRVSCYFLIASESDRVIVLSGWLKQRRIAQGCQEAANLTLHTKNQWPHYALISSVTQYGPILQLYGTTYRLQYIFYLAISLFWSGVQAVILAHKDIIFFGMAAAQWPALGFQGCNTSVQVYSPLAPTSSSSAKWAVDQKSHKRANIAPVLSSQSLYTAMHSNGHLQPCLVVFPDIFWSF